MRNCAVGRCPAIRISPSTGSWANTGLSTRAKAGASNPPGEGRALTLHSHTSIHRHIKVQATRSPYDGDWVYWGLRLGRHPTISPRVARHLRKQQGRCRACGLYFTEQDTLEIDHIIPKAQGGHESEDNLPLLHRHCHARKT